MNPYDLASGPFLAGYVVLFGAALVLSFYLRSRDPDPSRIADTQGLNALDWAYLAGGPARTIEAAVVGLLQAGVIDLDTKAQTLTPTATVRSAPAYLAAFQHAITERTPISSLAERLKPAIQGVWSGLVARGLVYDRVASSRLRWTSCPPLLILAAGGAARIWQGVSNHHPVGFIVTLTFMAAGGGLMFANSPPRVRQVGRDALSAHKGANERLMRAPADGELMEALALAGGAVLAGTPYAAFARMQTGAGGGDGGVIDSGGGGGGGGCGGGGH